MEDINQLTDAEYLSRLKQKDPDAFAEHILELLKKDPKYAIDDMTDFTKKLKAINKLRIHFEKRERFEDCAFLMDLKQRIMFSGTQN